MKGLGFMIANPYFEVINIAGEYLAVPVGKKAASFNGVVALSEAAAFVLKALSIHRSHEQLVDLLVREYDIDVISAQKDIGNIIQTFFEYGLIME